MKKMITQNGISAINANLIIGDADTIVMTSVLLKSFMLCSSKAF